MPRAGGESDKLGNRYEGIWTVSQMLDLLVDSLRQITVEPIREDGEGIEFTTLDATGILNFHSVKRQRAGGEWTLSPLSAPRVGGRSILGDLFGKLRSTPHSQCSFISSTGANALRELSERARLRASSADFDIELSRSDSLRQAFERYVVPSAGDRAAAFELLHRTNAVLIDEQSLIRQVDRVISGLVYRPDGQPVSAEDVRLWLADFVLNHLGSPFTASDVWQELNGKGLHRRDWARDTTVLDRVHRLNESYVRNVELELVNGGRIDRHEAARLLELVQNPSGPKAHLVSAVAGCGKSCVLAQLVARLRDTGIPVLSLRLDRHADVHNSQELGRQLVLPASPIVVLSGVANGGLSVIVVDQLDAVSQTSGRQTALWDVFEELRNEVAAYPNMHLIAACRGFDLQHDYRLRGLTRPPIGMTLVPVELLSDEDIDSALRRVGVDPIALTKNQRQILQIPLHLFLFLDGAGPGQPFANVADLFDRYWTRKREAVLQRRQGHDEWLPVIDTMWRILNERQALSVPFNHLDQWGATANAMISEHVLVLEDGHVRFFHEAFFDYAFARRASALGMNLLSILIGSEQHLSRRAQVRQILTYWRDRDRTRYLTELRGLLTSDVVRFHIKKSVLRWLESLTDPTAEEWDVLHGLLGDANLLRHVHASVRNRLPWFDLLDSLEVIRTWLNSDLEDKVNWALWLMWFSDIRKARSKRVAELLAPFRGVSETWTERLSGLMRWNDVHYSAEMQQLYLQLIEDGMVEDHARNHGHAFWHTLKSGMDSASEFVLRGIVTWLDHRIASRPSEGSIFDRWDYDQGGVEVLLTAAARLPEHYARSILPRARAIVESTAHGTCEGMTLDDTWSSHSCHHAMGTRNAVYQGLEEALRSLAVSTPDVLTALLDEFADPKFESLAFLMVRAWSANPERFSQNILAFFLEDSSRLGLGYGSWSGKGTGHSAIAREAIKAAIPYLTADEKLSLEESVLGYGWHREHNSEIDKGYTSRLLLEAMGIENLTATGAERLSQVTNHFPDIDTSIPTRQGFAMRAVMSPLTAEQTAAFTDEVWLASMRQFPHDYESGRPTPGRGGADELAHVLERQVRHDRQRYAALALKMEDSINPVYFDALLNGLCSPANMSKDERARDDEQLALVSTETLLAVIRRLDRVPGRRCGKSICRALERVSDRELAERDLELLGHYALNDSNPQGDPWLSAEWQPGRKEPPDLHFYGYNSVRGHAARAIEALLFADYRRAEWLVPILEQMVGDASIAVRTCVIEALLPMLNHDRNLAVQLVLKTCEAPDVLLGCYPFDNFCRFATSTHYAELRPLLARALGSSDEQAVAVAARQICLSGFGNELASEDAKQVRQGNVIMRTAAADVYGYNLHQPEVDAECAKHLPALFDDESADVRDKAADCFHRLTDDGIGRHAGLIDSYVESAAFPAMHDDLLRRLEESRSQLPDSVLRMAQRFIDKVGAQAGDVATSASADGATVAKLVVRLYCQASDAAVRSECLDAIDAMERLNFYGIDKELETADD